jgi:hypothetical protein
MEWLDQYWWMLGGLTLGGLFFWWLINQGDNGML